MKLWQYNIHDYRREKTGDRNDVAQDKLVIRYLVRLPIVGCQVLTRNLLWKLTTTNFINLFFYFFHYREQPIFTCKAHVFHIDPKTKRSWLPASSAAVSVSFFYDSSRALYRIISVEGTKVCKLLQHTYFTLI